jgi:hypothetical protein
VTPKLGRDDLPPGEHDPELPDGAIQTDVERELQAENAETSLDQPSQ